jgi:(p)ppGpp synthase/HD superfamily hydrolase
MKRLKTDDYDKLKIAARYWLLGMAEYDPEYFKVLDALEFGAHRHTGQRNGGQPEFIHQLGIFHQLRTLHRHISNPKTVYTLVFLHDVVEDKNVPLDEIEKIWGHDIRHKLDLLSKEVLGVKKTAYSLDPVFADEDASVVKGGDRVNNVSSMVGVFKRHRLERYVKETAEEFLPRLKEARRRFPHQEAVYEAIKLDLVNQLTLINHILDSYDPELEPNSAT